ncbi:MAG: rod shape-determining protein MreC [Candidatus Pacebacteria bacterium]|nr:rod shape-determining protein MreC [Candidatus Paceibacterota bacterium]
MTPDRRSNIWLLVGLAVVLLGFVIFEPSYGWKLRQFFTPTNIVPEGGAGNGNLAMENESLKAQLAELQAVAAELPTSSSGYVRAMVYSRYPLNFKNELIVNAGTDEGVATGSAVVFQGLLVGRVATVWSGWSVVQTVFDNSFKMPVRVGRNGYDGLLTGGSYPFVASIAKDKPVGANDIVYAAAPGIPYALPIGEVQSTSTSADNLFEQAALAFPYDVNNIETVMIAK